MDQLTDSVSHSSDIEHNMHSASLLLSCLTRVTRTLGSLLSSSLPSSGSKGTDHTLDSNEDNFCNIHRRSVGSHVAAQFLGTAHIPTPIPDLCNLLSPLLSHLFSKILSNVADLAKGGSKTTARTRTKAAATRRTELAKGIESILGLLCELVFLPVIRSFFPASLAAARSFLGSHLAVDSDSIDDARIKLRSFFRDAICALRDSLCSTSVNTGPIGVQLTESLNAVQDRLALECVREIDSLYPSKPDSHMQSPYPQHVCAESSDEVSLVLLAKKDAVWYISDCLHLLLPPGSVPTICVSGEDRAGGEPSATASSLQKLRLVEQLAALFKRSSLSTISPLAYCDLGGEVKQNSSIDGAEQVQVMKDGNGEASNRSQSSILSVHAQAEKTDQQNSLQQKRDGEGLDHSYRMVEDRRRIVRADLDIVSYNMLLAIIEYSMGL
jgi:hypothetical protein